MIKIMLDDRNLDYDAATERFEAAHRWAQKYCPSYQGHDVQDVADFSYMYDQLAMYEFGEERDSLWFQLRWL